MFVLTPADLPLATARSIHCRAIITPDTRQRTVARSLVRQALRDTLAGMLQVAPDTITLVDTPGQPLQLAAPWHGIGLSVSHEPGLSLLAINLAGPVGVDLLQLATVPTDFDAVARDYLGPAAASALAGLPAAQRQVAFARAWTRHEAQLKCLALDLREWTPELATRLAGCTVTELAMAAGWIAALAFPQH
jgi:4'-phosphopantetheinyl transferase